MVSNIVDTPHKIPPRASHVKVEAYATELAEVADQIASICERLSKSGGEVARGLRDVIEMDVKSRTGQTDVKNSVLDTARIVLIGGIGKIVDQLDVLLAGLAEASVFVRGIMDTNWTDTVVKSNNMSGEMFELWMMDDPIDQTEVVQTDVVVPTWSVMPVVRPPCKAATTPIKPAEMLTVEHGMKLGHPITVPDLCVMRFILMDLDGSDSVYYNEDSTLAVCDILAKFIETSKVTSEEYNAKQVKYPIMYLGNMFRGCWDIAVLVVVQGSDSSG